MRSPQLPLDLRINLAQQALPYLHPKLGSIPPPQLKDAESRRVKLRPKTEQDAELDDEWLGLGGDGGPSEPYDEAALLTIAANGAASLQAKAGCQAADNMIERESGSLPLRSDVPNIMRPEITRLSTANHGSTTTAHKEVSPMTFLRAVMLHPRTPLHQRLKVASILAPYLHAKQTAAPPSEKSFEVEDQYGFAVDPQLAKRLRDLGRQFTLEHPARAKSPTDRDFLALKERTRKKEVAADLEQNRQAKVAAEREAAFAAERKKLRYVETYRREDVEQDWNRLCEFSIIRKARELRPEEDSEEIHLTARAFSYQNSAEYAELQRLEDERNVLRNRRSKLYEKWCASSISVSEQQEFDRVRAFLNKTDADLHQTSPLQDPDPVARHFDHQLRMEAQLRGLPEPTREDIDRRLAEKQSSADIVPLYYPPRAKQDFVDFAAWLRGEVSYPAFMLRKSAPMEYRREPTVLIMIGLVRNEKIVPELELSRYFSWILSIYEEELSRGNDPAENIRAEWRKYSHDKLSAAQK